VFVGIGATASVSNAGIIVAGSDFDDPVSGYYASIVTVQTPDPGNDNYTGDINPNVLGLFKGFGALDPIDYVFTVEDSNEPNATEYRFFEEVGNITGLEWIGYHIELGFGTGEDFTPAPVGSNLDFDTGQRDSEVVSGYFDMVEHGRNELVFYDGLVPARVDIFGIIFPVDVPNGIDEFTLRQYPTPIPEPATVFLLGSGLVGLAGFRRKFRH
jgi:hypothetical protein